MQKLVMLGLCLLAATAYAVPLLEEEAVAVEFALGADPEGAEVDEVAEVAEDSVATRACNNAQCHRVCLRLGFRRGVCVDRNTCRCYR